MTEKRLSMGINVSILLILTIFGVLLSLPLRLLFDTNYDNRDRDGEETNVTDPTATGRTPVIPMDHRKLRRCPNLPYEDRLVSVFQSDYDGNCTYAQDDDDDDDDNDDNNRNSDDDDDDNDDDDDDDDDNDDDDDDDDDDDNDDNSEEEKNSRKNRKLGEIKKDIDELMRENAEDILKMRQMKSVTVAGHILVAMLLISVIAALIEVLRIRFEFAREKDSSRASTTTSRRCSSGVDLPALRRPTSRELIRSQRSFEIQGMHRSALRLLGARPPPLIRRSSFPTPQAKQAATSSFCGTPTNRLTRRQSAESDEETRVVTNILHHRIRLIRRH